VVQFLLDGAPMQVRRVIELGIPLAARQPRRW
jgi:hypothetical protein